MFNIKTSSNTKKLHIGYVRVSSYEQAERNVSIPSQIEQIEQYAFKNGIILTKIYKEEHSAFKGNRKVFDQMIKDIKAFDGCGGSLIVFKIDRISRSADDFMRIEKIISEKDMEFISVTEPMMSNYLGRYMMRDMQNRAILYSEELSFRVRLGMRKKLQMGGSLGGSTPFGFAYLGDKYERDEQKAPIVKYIFESYAEGKKGYREIAKDIRLLYGLKKFTHRKVDFTLQNTLYCGFKSKTWKLSNEEYLIRGYDKPGTYTEEYPLNYIKPIISRELFDRCMAIRLNRSKSNQVKDLQVELFRPVFKCTCGRNLRRDDKKGHRYLRCRNSNSLTYEHCSQRKCIKLSALDDRISKDINRLIPESLKLKELIDEIDSKLLTSSEKINLEKGSIQEKQIELKGKLSELTLAYANNKISNEIFEISTSTIQDQMKRNNERIDMLTALEDNHQSLHLTRRFIEEIKVIRSEVDSYERTKYDLHIQKSSPYFSVLFSTVANCIVGAQSISNYELFEEFDVFNIYPCGQMAEPTRLELATSAVTVLRSNQLNYGSTKITKELQTE